MLVTVTSGFRGFSSAGLIICFLIAAASDPDQRLLQGDPQLKSAVAEPALVLRGDQCVFQLPALLQVGLNHWLCRRLMPLPVHKCQLHRAGLKCCDPAKGSCLRVSLHSFVEFFLHHEKPQRTAGAPPVQAVFVEIQLSRTCEQRSGSTAEKRFVGIAESLAWHHAGMGELSIRDGASLRAVEHCRQMRKWSNA